MKILALDTSTPVGSLAVAEGQNVLAELSLPGAVTFSRTLLPEIKRILDITGLSVNDLDALAVGLGPGSFTGLRIGLAAAKGLAWAAGRPLIGVPTLEAMVQGLPPSPWQACPLLPARKNLVYAAFYQTGPDGRWERRSDFAAFPPEKLVQIIQRETIFFGLGLEICARMLADALGPLFRAGPSGLSHPRAVWIIQTALDLFDRDVETDPVKIVPLYVRPPDLREPGGGFKAAAGGGSGRGPAEEER